MVIDKQQGQQTDQSDQLHAKSGCDDILLSDNNQRKTNNKDNNHNYISYDTNGKAKYYYGVIV